MMDDASQMPAIIPPLEPVMLEAEPEPLEIDLRRIAVIVIDMQNAFVSKGAFFDLLGRIDTSLTQKIIDPIKKVTNAARAKGIKVIYTAPDYPPDFHYCGGPNSPSWYKENSLRLYREHPEWRDKLLMRGTWGAEIVEELKPQEGDIVTAKMKYSAFFGTNLDIILKTFNMKYLAAAGVATNICVEATLRDAFYYGYFPILISDACANAGPPFTQEATIFNVKACYGWVTTAENLTKAIQAKRG